MGDSRAELLAMGAEQIQADPNHDAAWLQEWQRPRCAGQPHRGVAQRALQRGEPLETRHRLVLASGEQRHVYLTGQVECDD